MRLDPRWSSLFALLLCISGAHAQGAARVLDLDPSIRSSGMGGASAAVFWGGDANGWANPALFGYQSGLRFEHGRTQLVPDLADDVYLTTDRITIGSGWFGLSLAGRPVEGLGRIRLDYGRSEYTDEYGNPLGSFSSHEEVASWGAGVSVGGFIEALARWRGAEPPALTRWVDLAFGVSSKDVDVVLAPRRLWGTASATGDDVGLLLRATPLDNTRGATPPVPLRLDLSYGHSILNYNDENVVFIPWAQPSPLSRIFFDGFAARVAVGLPATLRSSFGGRDWLADSFEPMLSVGLARDHEHVQAGADANGGYDVTHLGAEVTALNLLTVRSGYLDDPSGERSGATFGLGIGFQLGRFLGFRYDYGTLPEATGLSDLKRHGYTIFVDPVAFYRAQKRS
jgi:hypothetical protein